MKFTESEFTRMIQRDLEKALPDNPVYDIRIEEYQDDIGTPTRVRVSFNYEFNGYIEERREAQDDIGSKSQTLEDFLEHNFVPEFDDIWIKATVSLFREYWQGEITLEELKSRYPKMLGDEFVERFSFFLEEYKDQH